MKGKLCPCPHHKVSALVLLVVGILFLLRDFNVWDFWNIQWWSALFVLLGLGKLCKRACSCCC